MDLEGSPTLLCQMLSFLLLSELQSDRMFHLVATCSGICPTHEAHGEFVYL